MITNPEILKHAKVLWDYHIMSMRNIPHADFVIALGSHDVRAAHHAANLLLEGQADLLVVTGGVGKVTNETWRMTEAAKYQEIAVGMGVNAEVILVEDKATNTGDNFLFSKRLFEEKGVPVKSGIIVTKPYMSRRAFATGSKQWPEIDWYVSAPNIPFEEYPNDEVTVERTVNLMVGDLQRIAIYPQKGFQIEQQIPDSVWASYHYLVNKGFDEFVIK